MSVPLLVNGATFNYPVTGDTSWGVDATGWAQAVTSGMLQKAGGSFPLTAEVNFGSSFGIVSSYLKSAGSPLAAAGVIRLAKTDLINWRNNANLADNSLAVNGSDQLTFNGVVISTGNVTSIVGTANEIIASSPTGNVTLSTPQAIAPTSSPTFAALTLSSPLSVANGGTGTTTPSLIAGTNVSITGSWPNQTVNAATAVNAGTTGDFAYYATTGSVLSDAPFFNYSVAGPIETLSFNPFGGAGTLARIQIHGGASGAGNGAAINFFNNGQITTLFQNDSSEFIFLDFDNTIDWLKYTRGTGLVAGVPLSMASHKITSLTQGTTGGDAIAFPVSTPQLAANAVTQIVGNGSTGSTDFTTTITTQAITTSGGPVLVIASANLQTTTGGAGAQITAAVTRGGTAIPGNQSQFFYSPAAQIVNETVAITCIDTPAAGSYTYNFTCQITSGSGSTPVANLFSLVLVELKR